MPDPLHTLADVLARYHGRIGRTALLRHLAAVPVYAGGPTRWANPWDFRAYLPGAADPPQRRQVAADRFHEALIDTTGILSPRLNFLPSDLAALRGRDLVCWCPLDHPCHADALLALANAPLRCSVVGALVAAGAVPGNPQPGLSLLGLRSLREDVR